MINNPQRIRLLVSKLPEPSSVYSYDGANFAVYLARDFKGWISEDLKDMVEMARFSYYRYGKRKLLDEYDDKSAIVLVRATYKIEKEKRIFLVSEWLSSRLVDGGGMPIGVGEPEIYSYKNEPVDRWLGRNILRQPDYWKSIASTSRMCGIHPYFENESDENSGLILTTKHMYTAICFALIYKLLMAEADNKGFQYFTGIILNRFVASSLTVYRGGLKAAPYFVPAYDLLECYPDEIKLNRNIYAYQYPTYWLNAAELSLVLINLIKGGQLSDYSIKKYAAPDFSFREIFSRGFYSKLEQLGGLLTVQGPIEGSLITSDDLRKIIDEKVSDGPELKITRVEKWNESIDQFLAFLEIKKI